MSVSQSSLISRLAALIPTRDGIPTSSQQQQAIVDAVAALSSRLPMTKQTTLTLTAGTSSYSLPSDFLFLIRLQYPDASRVPYRYNGYDCSSAYSTSAGLVAVAPYRRITRDDYTIVGQTITFTPPALQAGDYTLRYGAAHVLEGDGDTYADMDEAFAAVVVLKAQADVLRLQAAQAAQDADVTGYEQGDVSIELDGSKGNKALLTQAGALDSEYERRVMHMQGAQGMRAYPW
jgi:hypothetical protein